MESERTLGILSYLLRSKLPEQVLLYGSISFYFTFKKQE